MECETVKAAWTKLEEEYVGTSRTRHMQAQSLRRHFDMIRMKESQFVKEYIDQILKLTNQIKLFGEELKEVRVVENILNNVPGKFEPTIASLLQSKDLPDISITEIVNALQAAELRISARDEALEEKAFLAKGKGKAKAEAFTKKNYNDKDKKTTQSGQSSNKKNKFKPCSSVRKGIILMTTAGLGQMQSARYSDFESDLGNCEWLLDSGSSRHIALFEAVFVDLDKNH
ncbi:PREDICTED: uncharacterized protein LOC108662809 [Theobroma cacao]|uniref:Uncharacterized protein LOC108662809 n=1 Tax=Theobroma cacao TaxID=3641 RepID=A0AB32WMI3_THECC|nr:PREDICTED: uncharacterized protein LOC108662809 [Theobroma cacao]